MVRIAIADGESGVFQGEKIRLTVRIKALDCRSGGMVDAKVSKTFGL